jgi:hypothetical protein
MPETKGRSLEEISEVFGDAFVSVHIAEPLSEKDRADAGEEARVESVNRTPA